MPTLLATADTALFSRTRRFNNCIQRGNVRLKCDVFDDADDRVGVLRNTPHCVDYLSHGFATALRA
jgi:hypothetical protein